MESIYAVLLLSEADAELNEANLTAVLEAAGHHVTEARVRALVAALEGVDVKGDLDRTPNHEGTGARRKTATVDADGDSRATEDRSTSTDTDEVS